MLRRVYIDIADAATRRRAQRDVADAGWLEVSRAEDAELVISGAPATQPGVSLPSRSPGAGTRTDDDSPFQRTQEALTAREHQVLSLLAEGLGNRDIAERLSLSEHTVKFHLSAIFGKLGASTRTDAVRKALRLGLIDL